MRRLPIRTKLAVALAVPLLALIAVTVLEVAKTSREVGDIARQTELAKSAIGPSGIITALQNERTWIAVDLIGQQDAVQVPVEGYEETRARTDEAIAAFSEDLDRRGDTASEAFQPPMDGLDALEEVRAEIDASTAPRTADNIEFAGAIFDRYTGLIEPFFTATTQVSLAVNDADLRQGAELADTVARQIETMSLLLSRTITYATLSSNGIDESSEITEVAMLHSDFLNYADTLRNATGIYGDLAAERFPAELTASTSEQIDAALSTGQVELGTLLGAVDSPPEENYNGYQAELHDVITTRADDLRSAAEARRVWFGALAVLALLVAIALTWMVSRSITRPLRSLTRQAKEMAEHRLPDAVLDILETPLGDDVEVPHIAPIAVQTRDEVADVAEALNTVQDSALDLAVEQAVLRRNIADSFVNLGRRNQNLLGRQLDFITELESNETDPDTLASLFRLDHLATRMRRNAESLLVLAGIEPPRKWAAPVRITDVIRAALGEVEDYQRVTIRGVEPATILGSVAADLAHLIAEFVENALTFSPPDQKVDVRGRHAPNGGYTLAVIDQGFGMSPADIAQANRRLSGTESFTIAPSKYLGHYVAGNLAARHGIHIQLDSTPGHGITATIDLPPTLLTNETPTNDPITDPHGNRAIVTQAVTASAPAPAPAPGPGPGRPSPVAPAAGPLGGPASAAPPPAERTRTPSGLVKRSPRGDRPADRPAATVPSADLLAALESHTSKLGPDRRPGGPGAPAGPVGRGGPGAGGPASPDRPALPRRPGPGQPTAPPPGVGGRPGGDPSPFGPGAPAPNGPVRGPAGAGPPGGAPLPPPPAAWPPPAPPPAAPRRPATPPPPAAAGPAPAAGGTTPSGLARRVRGAQLPSTQPLSLRRGGRAAGQPAAPPPDGGHPPRAGGGPGPGPGRGPGPRPSAAAGPGPSASPGTGAGDTPAKDVYSFLSNFSAGVQRGLDEARRTDDPDDGR